MARVYHFLPGNMRGNVLHPLNVLRDLDPSAYEEHVAKYQGREHVMGITIPPLNLLWNDVLHLSPVHPAKIRDGLLSAGFDWYSGGIDCVEIDPERIGFDATNTCLFRTRVPSMPRLSGQDPFEPYTLDAIERNSDLSSDVVDYYRSCSESGGRPLTFQGVTHVLHGGSIDIRDTDIIHV